MGFELKLVNVNQIHNKSNKSSQIKWDCGSSIYMMNIYESPTQAYFVVWCSFI